MRSFLMLSILALVACSPSSPGGNSATPVVANSTADTGGKRGNEPADSPSARAARDVVERYFKSIEAKDYAAAYRLWGNDGADAGGSLKDFEQTFALYSKYEPEAGAPTEIRARDGMQYVAVAAKLFVENRTNRKTANKSGTVLLRRSVDPADPVASKRDWRIWGVDLRVKN